MELKREK